MDRRPEAPPSLTPAQARAVRDVGALCAARAAASLSILVKVQVRVGAPELLSVDVGGISALFGGAEAPALGVLVPFGGDLEGNTLLLFPEEGTVALEGLLFADPSSVSGKMRASAFAEIGNILAGAFVSVLSSLTSRVLVNQPPAVVRDMAGALFDALVFDQRGMPASVHALVYPLSRSDGGGIVKAVILLDQATASLLVEAAGRLEPPP